MTLTLRCGVYFDLEWEANAILALDRQQQMTTGPLTRRPRRRSGGGGFDQGEPTRYHFDDLNDWLSEEQLELRRSREVLNSLGYVGEYQIRGVYGRAYNPLLGKRPSTRKLILPGMDPWKQLLWEELGCNWSYHPGKMQYPANNISDRRPWPGDIQDNIVAGEAGG